MAQISNSRPAGCATDPFSALLATNSSAPSRGPVTVAAGRTRVRVLALGACLAAGLAAPLARAQDHFAGDSLASAPAFPNSALSVWGSRTLEAKQWAVALDASYARRPLTLRAIGSDNTIADLVGSISTFELLGSLGLFGRFDVTLALPLEYVTSGTELSASAPVVLRAATVDSDTFALGDIRLVPRVALLSPDGDADADGVGLALLLPLWLPTGDDNVYVGEDFRVEPRLALDFALGRLKLALNAGYLVRSQAQLLGATIDDMVSWGVGAAISLIDPLSLVLEVSGHLNVLTNDFGSDDAPTEILGALRFNAGRWRAQAGGGPGIAGGVTEPSWRLLAAVSYISEPTPRDRDGDGLTDDVDRCPGQAEDADGFEDEDGCPDLDDDRDGIADASDRCPREPEDVDGFEDQDGCPDRDNDHDGIADGEDACPIVAGQPSDDASKRGCPDRDGDGVLDEHDACPDVAGVASDDPAANGCPKPADRDGDGIIDAQDACPDAAGPADPQPTLNGCPKARIEQGEIKILERVEFATNSAQLLAPSDEPLRGVENVLKEHVNITKLTIEGHTDNVGRDAYNMKLSKRRADAVRAWLIAHGIAAERLEAKGIGPTRPIDDNATPEGRTRNRRVEFHIASTTEPPATTTAAP